MIRRILFTSMVFLVAATASHAQAQIKKPNFLIILSDDLGYGDLGCYGHEAIRTPNLDKLAKQGMRFTECYAASAVCSPSRAGLLTGRIPTRSGVYTWIAPGNPMHLPKSEITIAALFRQLGYRTAHVGKWHLNGLFNSAEQPQPGDHGFEHWFSTQNNAVPTHENPKNFVRNGQAVGTIQGFSCQIVAEEAIRWLKAGRDSSASFFLFVCFHEPHEKVASPPNLVASYPKAKNEDQAQYFANVTNMDLAAGRLLDALDQLGVADNTFVFFTSDNGPETLNRYKEATRSYGVTGPLRGRKLWLFEGGIRVPGIMRWPGHVPPAQTSAEPLWSLDLFPTLAKITGAKMPSERPIDGSDFLPALQGHHFDRKTPLFWHYYRSLGEPRVAMREGDWVILAHSDAMQKGAGGTFQAGDMDAIKKARLTTFELYNLKDDLGQTNDLAKKEPDRLRKMSDRMQALFGEVTQEGSSWAMPGKK